MYFVNLKINRCTKKLVFACKASLSETNNRVKFSCNFSRKLTKFTNTPMLLQNNPNVTRGHELVVKISNSASSASVAFFHNSYVQPCTSLLHLNTAPLLLCDSKHQLVWCSCIITHTYTKYSILAAFCGSLLRQWLWIKDQYCSLFLIEMQTTSTARRRNWQYSPGGVIKAFLLFLWLSTWSCV